MLAEKKICTGCGACAAGCPLKCIEMQVDREGFRYPIIDGERCISCRKCEALCPVLNKLPIHAEPQALGAKHKDDGIRSLSSSGGVFPALASFVLENGGAVCGAAYLEDFSVEHRIIEDGKDIVTLQGAKYAQSRAEHLFPQIRSILESGRYLLFTGTPCQTAGLKAYLNKDYAKLILVDMICHGVPSPEVWKRYLKNRNQIDAAGANIDAINLRCKKSGWSHYSYSVAIDYSNGTSYNVPQGQDLFMQGFVNNLYLRPACANCDYKGLQRCSDMTLGDFWGVWELVPDFDDDRGISLLLLHTSTGIKAWEAVCRNFDVRNIDCQPAIACNPSVLASSAPHPMRQVFFEHMETEQMNNLIQRCLHPEEKRVPLLIKIRNWICR